MHWLQLLRNGCQVFDYFDAEVGLKQVDDVLQVALADFDRFCDFGRVVDAEEL